MALKAPLVCGRLRSVPTSGLPYSCNLAVTIGAGVQWGALYNAVAEHNKVVVGGIGAGGTVGAGGGWPMGGGHSILSPFYGLGMSVLANEKTGV